MLKYTQDGIQVLIILVKPKIGGQETQDHQPSNSLRPTKSSSTQIKKFDLTYATEHN